MSRKSIQDRLKSAVKAADDAKAKAEEKQPELETLRKEIMDKRDEKILKKFKSIFPEQDLALMSEPEFDKFLKGVQMTRKDEVPAETDSVKKSDEPVKENQVHPEAQPVQQTSVNNPVSQNPPKQASPYHEEREVNRLFAKMMQEQNTKEQQNQEQTMYPRGYVPAENRHSDQNG